MAAPLVSVLMPVRNMERTIGEALRSLLQQTFDDLEVIVVNDGCTDRSLDVIWRLGDPRIVVVPFASRLRYGVPQALNAGLALARGRYVARQDADDVSFPTRMQRQIEALARDPGCAGIGTAVEVIDADGRTLHYVRPPRSDRAIRERINTRSPFFHGSVMMRRAALQAVEGYRPFYRCEDYDLWLRLLERFRMANLGEVLYRFRLHGHALSRLTLHRTHRERRLAWELALQRRAGSREDRGLATGAVRSAARPRLAEAERDYRSQRGNLFMRQGRPLAALGEYLRAIACRPLRWRTYVAAAAALLGPRGGRALRHALSAAVAPRAGAARGR